MAFDSTEFSTPTGIRWNGDVGVVEYNRQKYVSFYRRPHHSPQKSNDAGRPVYEDKIFVRIQEPGDRTTVIDRPIREEDKRVYANQWRAFVDNNEQVAEGTPIEMYRPQTPSIAATLRGNGVQTIEQCANLSGHAIDTIGMGAQQWSNECKSYLDVAHKGVNASQLRAELDERDSNIRVLSQQVEMLKNEVNRLSLAGNSDQFDQMQKLVMAMAQRPNMQTMGIDIEQERINANHPTQELAKRGRGRPPKIDKGVPVPSRKRLGV